MRRRRCWHPVAFSGQVGTAPAARALLSTHVVLWRTPDGRLRSALDRCPHRWAQLSKPLDPRLQAHTKHDRPGIAYRQALTDFLADPS